MPDQKIDTSKLNCENLTETDPFLNIFRPIVNPRCKFFLPNRGLQPDFLRNEGILSRVGDLPEVLGRFRESP